MNYLSNLMVEVVNSSILNEKFYLNSQLNHTFLNHFNEKLKKKRLNILPQPVSSVLSVQSAMPSHIEARYMHLFLSHIMSQNP